MKRFAGRMVTLVGWLVSSKRTRTVKNEFMKFLMLEDRTASFEVTLFPKVYRQFGILLRDRGPYLVRGRVEQDGLCFTITAHWLGRMTATGH
jgi:DNA polymerase III alpha subunit